MSQYLPSTEVLIAVLRGTTSSPESVRAWRWLVDHDMADPSALDASCASYAQISAKSATKGSQFEWNQRLRVAEMNNIGPVPWSLTLNEKWGEVFGHLVSSGLIDLQSEKDEDHNKRVELLELAVCTTAIIESYSLLVFEDTPWLAELKRHFNLKYLVIQ